MAQITVKINGKKVKPKIKKENNAYQSISYLVTNPLQTQYTYYQEMHTK